MAWEERHGRRYYYRKEWRSGRVRSVYVGKDFPGDLAASLDALDALEKRREREERRRLREQLDEHREAVEAATKACRDVLAAAMIATGHYQHKREWRRKGARNNIEGGQQGSISGAQTRERE